MDRTMHISNHQNDDICSEKRPPLSILQKLRDKDKAIRLNKVLQPCHINKNSSITENLTLNSLSSVNETKKVFSNVEHKKRSAGILKSVYEKENVYNNSAGDEVPIDHNITTRLSNKIALSDSPALFRRRGENNQPIISPKIITLLSSSKLQNGFFSAVLENSADGVIGLLDKEIQIKSQLNSTNNHIPDLIDLISSDDCSESSGQNESDLMEKDEMISTEQRICQSKINIPVNRIENASSINVTNSNASTKVTVDINAFNEWVVVLLVDKRERMNAFIQAQMIANGIPCELDTLAVGDFLWVLKPLSSMHKTNIESLSKVNDEVIVYDELIEFSTGLTQDIQENMTLTTQPVKKKKITSTQKKSKKKPSEIVNENETGEEDSNALHRKEYLVLDCVAERKTISDLAASIVDGRYQEQKHRLKSCQIRSCIYVVEGESMKQLFAIGSEQIKSAMISTHVWSGLHILRTRNVDHTIESLQALHRQVIHRYEKGQCGKTFQTFSNFQSLNGKKKITTLGQLFGHVLRQIHGCSSSIATILMEKYETIPKFIQFFQENNQIKAENELANLSRHDDGQGRKLGPKLAHRLWEIFATEY